MEKINKALIPAAGKGTRLYPVTKFIPKELLPVAGKALIHYCLDELIQANIKEIYIVINRNKEIIKKYVKDLIKNINIRFIYQENPIGVADAIYQVKKFIKNEPFLLIMPDNIIVAKVNPILQLMNTYEKLSLNVNLGILHTVTKNNAFTYGNCGKVDSLKVRDNLYKIKRLYNKGSGQFDMKGKNTSIRGCGRGIFQGIYFEYIEKLRDKIEGEFDDTYVYQEMLTCGEEFYGILLKGKVFDCGNIYGYAYANYSLIHHQSC